MTPVLFLDSNFLVWRAHYATGAKGEVILPFMKAVQELQDRFGTQQVVFCWDHGRGIREQRYTFYKALRRNRKMSPGELKAMQVMRDQIADLKLEVLPKIGYVNIHYAPGYEADDLIAALLVGWGIHQPSAVIVSGDSDLLQLLDDNISLYNPRSQETLTRAKFKTRYGILPQEWPLVKAMAGCKSDGIGGIPKVGEITALKYLRRELRENHPAIRNIESHDGQKTIERNMELVQLPYAGCPQFPIHPQPEIDPAKWRSVLGSRV